MVVYCVVRVGNEQDILGMFTTHEVAQASIDLSYCKCPERKGEVRIVLKYPADRPDHL